MSKDNSTTEQVYGLEIKIPPRPRLSEIDGYELTRSEQYFRIPEPRPGLFDVEIDFVDGNPVFDDEQLEFIDREMERWDNGYWFMRKGEPCWIDGFMYYFLTCYILEDGHSPNYRTASRRWHLFHGYCYWSEHVFGVIRGKKRREGATGEAVSAELKVVSTTEDAYGGNVSKTGDDSAAMFVNVIRKAFQKLPIWAKPRCVDEDSSTNLDFRVVSKKKRNQEGDSSKKTVKKKAGLESRIDFRRTALNAYDSGRLTYGLVDEGGKFPAEVDIYQYWFIFLLTLKKGARKVGFGMMPSTVNEMTKGGKGFLKLWEESNQANGEITGTGMYRYFSPAFEGYEPYIDKYGDSIIDTPTPEQARWMKEKYRATNLQCSMGAKAWLDYEESLLKTAEGKRGHRRLHPRTEDDMFDFDEDDKLYDIEKIKLQREKISQIKDAGGLKERVGYFTIDYENMTASWNDSTGPDAMWTFIKMPDPGMTNIKRQFPGEMTAIGYVPPGMGPGRADMGSIGADPFKNTIVTGAGSMGAAVLGPKENSLDPENTGMPFGVFHGRPKRRRAFHEQMLGGAIFWGFDVTYESDFDDYLEFLESLNMLHYAKKRPKSTLDPTKKAIKKEKMGYGVKAADGFSYSVLIDKSVLYVQTKCHKILIMSILDDLFLYKEGDRTSRDISAAFQVWTVAISESVKYKEPPKRTAPVVKVWRS